MCDHRECMVDGATERTRYARIIMLDSVVFTFPFAFVFVFVCQCGGLWCLRPHLC